MFFSFRVVFPLLVVHPFFSPFQPRRNFYGSYRGRAFFLAHPAAHTGFPDRGPEAVSPRARLGALDKYNWFFILDGALLKTDLTRFFGQRGSSGEIDYPF